MSKIFLLVESVYNGTVTMSNHVTGVKADSFEDAKEKIRRICKKKGFQISTDTDDDISYYNHTSGSMTLGGTMNIEELNFLSDD